MEADMATERNAATGFKRGLARRCPNCGEGHLFRGYLAVDPTCEACGHENSAYRADDGPTYFTVLIIGHLLVAPLLALPFLWQGDPWIVLPIVLIGVTVATLTLLGFVKGAFIGVQWGTRATATQ
jgi:uncharacterized protein (DUF983 family)